MKKDVSTQQQRFSTLFLLKFSILYPDRDFQFLFSLRFFFDPRTSHKFQTGQVPIDEVNSYKVTTNRSFCYLLSKLFTRKPVPTLHNCYVTGPLIFAITASATLEAGEGGHSGDDGETPGNTPASTGCPGSGHRS